ncbi:hypothetical protein GA0115240_17612 [Streptomyces sp. DvalAA-14]|uniref:DUF6099 family protein n=1 Tax=unclassified Streptomyces TaxID=2593676 RepID=UPI00081B95A5|nr:MULTISPECIES: DUF6099 family protein [unclassified Streptomyces]MYS25207.1 hypothetical protein [Streptomyces sp. SID4948]SCE52941.1 hypothetical protein GA0115240_17612 [Streptomyces sp. DvalAA-14]
MDAARLVAEAERALRDSPQPEQVIAEAWQAYELTEAVGRLLGDALGQPGVRAGRAPVVTAAGAGPPRAARLSGVRDPDGTLRALRTLLGEIGLTLVGITCTADDEAAYWHCIEALDAVDEAKDRIRELARAGGD